MTYAHVLHIEEPTQPLELELLALYAEYVERERTDLSRCRRLAVNWQRWKRERNLSVNDYLRHVIPDFETESGEGSKAGTGYRHLYTGVALEAGFEGRNQEHLSPYGRALEVGGYTLADLHALIAEHGDPETRKLIRKAMSGKAKEATTTIRLPDTAALNMDTLAARVRALPGAPAQDTECRAIAVQVVTDLPEALFAVAARAQLGDPDARTAYTNLAQSIEHGHPDFYEELKRPGCLHPTCQTRQGIELHHMARGEGTKRGGEYMVPLCPYHHAPDGSHDSAHGMTRDAFYALWGGEAAFLWAVWERYAQAAQAVRRKA